MANVMYDADEALALILANSDGELTDSDDEIVADVEDEEGRPFALPQIGQNIPAHEKEPILMVDNEVNSASEDEAVQAEAGSDPEHEPTDSSTVSKYYQLLCFMFLLVSELCVFTFHGNLVEAELPNKPAIISDYNVYMNGVDRNDQLLTYYSLNMKSVKWWKKVFWRLFELSLVNMYQILKFKEPSTIQKRLRLDLAQLLVQPLLDQRTIQPALPGPGRPAPDFDRLKGKHFGTGSKKGSRRGRCKVCAKQKKANGKCKDNKTSNFCERCKVFHCEGECFKAYHTKQQI